VSSLKLMVPCRKKDGDFGFGLVEKSGNEFEID
jgi:hypothetical protein